MGKKAKMSLLLIVGFVVLLPNLGCEEEEDPPAIRVERTDTNSWAGATIYFDNHECDGGGTHFVVLDTPEKVEAYREEVEFLLDRLSETETRMNVHEPEIELLP